MLNTRDAIDVQDLPADLDQLECDLVVIGAGMAGLTAAARAARHGCTVLVVEKGDVAGGNARLSRGVLWTLTTSQQYLEECPAGSSDIGAALIESRQAATAFAEELGVEFSETPPLPIEGAVGVGLDIVTYLERCAAAVAGAGGHIVTNCNVRSLVVDDGAVVGVLAEDRDGPSVLRAPWTMLATGGFQANREMREAYLGAGAANALLRSNPHSTGDGILLGLSAGAALVDDMSGFYGHAIAHPLREPFVLGDFSRLAQSIYATHALLFARHGDRVVDESTGYYRIGQAVAHVEGSTAVLVGDEHVRGFATRSPGGGIETVDLLDEAERAGAHVARAETLSSLATQLDGWGFAGARIVDTIEAFNLAMQGDDDVEPPRRRNRRPLADPPWFAVEVQPSVTFTHGGLRMNVRGQALRSDGSPVAGLLISGADAGGIHNGGYVGGLAAAAGFGVRAADLVVASRAAASH
jgi:succinate dehydrogenase/fumarate reductase flavoprotein subunit